MDINQLTGLFSGVSKEQTKTLKSIDYNLISINNTLGKIHQESIANRSSEENRFRTTQQLLKEKENRNPFDALSESLKKNEEKKKDGFGDLIKGLLSSVEKLLGPITGKLALLVGAFVGGQVIGGQINEHVVKPIQETLNKAGNKLDDALNKITSGGKAGKGLNFGSKEVSQLQRTANDMVIQLPEGATRDQWKKDKEALIELSGIIRKRQELNNQLYDIEKKTLPEREKELENIKKNGPPSTGFGGVPEGDTKKIIARLEENIKELRKQSKDLKINISVSEEKIKKVVDSRPGLRQQLEPVKKQFGGIIDVPGHGNGDIVPMMLQAGDYVLNRNAAEQVRSNPFLFQQGGAIPTLLEPREMVIRGGDIGELHKWNNAFPRFQKGGEVATNSTGGDKILQILGTTNKLVGFGKGMCTKSVARTLDENKIPNPETNADPNNPRGYAIGLVNNFGWKTVGGTPTQLSGADGSASMGIMSHDNYKSFVSQNQVPSGSIIMSTRHKDWLGNFSSGYDTAIARSGGKQLYNGDPRDAPKNTPSMYGDATTSNMVLVPTGSTLKGDFTEGSGSGGDTASNPLSILGGMGQIGSAVAEFFQAFISSLGPDLGWLANSIFGITPGQTTASDGMNGAGSFNGKTFDTSLTPNRKAMLDAISYAEGTSQQPDSGYKTMFTGKQFKAPPWKHPDQAITSGSRTSTAAGRYQFLTPTWYGTAKGGEDFSPAQQDKGAINLLAYRNALGAVDKGDWKGAFLQANKEWASFPESPHGQPTKKMPDLVAFTAARAKEYGSTKPLGDVAHKQTGGPVGISPSSSPSIGSRIAENQNKFAAKVASMTSGGNTIVVNNSSAPSQNTVSMGSDLQRMAPTLSEGPSSWEASQNLYNLALSRAF